LAVAKDSVTPAHYGLRQRHLTEIADGSFVVSNQTTLAEWINHWLSIGAPGKKRKAVGRKTLERYAQLLRVHVIPTLGNRPLQKLQSTEIDALYVRLAEKISARTAHHIHNVLGSCLRTATRTRKLARNPMLDVIKVPSPAEADHGIALDADELRTLIQGFRPSVLFPIVAVAAFTGARRGEILALRWEDFNAEAKTLRIERAIEETQEHGLQIKGPKTERGKRTIEIDDDLVALLKSERERYLRIVAGVPDGAAVDLSLVKLPPGALMFPCPRRGAKRSHSQSCAAQRTLRTGSRSWRPSWGSGCGCTISGARTKPYCLTLACPYTGLPPGAAMIRPSSCGATPNARARPIDRPLASLGRYHAGRLANKNVRRTNPLANR
jgi:integrase